MNCLGVVQSSHFIWQVLIVIRMFSTTATNRKGETGGGKERKKENDTDRQVEGKRGWEGTERDVKEIQNTAK